MKLESEVQQEVQIAGPEYHCILMRNNVGAFTDATGRNVRFGLGNISKNHSDQMKSSDLIGIKSIVITPDMVGKMIGVLTAIEVKKEGFVYNSLDKRQRAQNNFIEWVKLRGGIAGFVSSVEDFKKLMNDFMAKVRA